MVLKAFRLTVLYLFGGWAFSQALRLLENFLIPEDFTVPLPKNF
jgi:hypothetical protein